MEFPTIDEFAKNVAEKVLDEIIYGGKTIREWIEIIIKQQPCDDAISRQAAIDAIAKIHPIDTEYDCTLYDKLDVMYVLKDLPPVTPLPKTGKWIRHPFYDYLVCSKCLSGAPYKYCETNYCPNCGSRMIEPQESEKQDMKSLQHI